jgi:hypothetical protein
MGCRAIGNDNKEMDKSNDLSNNKLGDSVETKDHTYTAGHSYSQPLSALTPSRDTPRNK